MRKLQVKGSFFLKDKGRFFKVITVRPVGDNRYVFGCRELGSEKSEVLTFRLLGLLDAMDAAASVMRTRKSRKMVTRGLFASVVESFEDRVVLLHCCLKDFHGMFPFGVHFQATQLSAQYYGMERL